MNDIAILCFNLKLMKESEKVYQYALQAYENVYQTDNAKTSFLTVVNVNQVYGHIHPSTAQVQMNFASFYKLRSFRFHIPFISFSY